MTTGPKVSTERKKGGKGWIIILLLLILALAGLNGYVYMNFKKAEELNKQLSVKIDTLEILQKELEKRIQLYEDSIARLKASLDEKDAELAAKIAELEEKNQKIKRLQGAIWRLKKKLKEYEQQGPKPEEGGPSIVEQYQQLQQEYQQLKQQYDALMAQLSEKDQTIENLMERLKDMESQLGSFIPLKSLEITPIRVKAGEEYPTKKARKVSAIKVCFTPETNPHVKDDEIEIAFRIIDPEGVTLYNETAGSGRFTTPEGREKPYTFKNNFVYPPVNTPVCTYWEPFAPLTKGTHKLELYYNGRFMGGQSFQLK